MTFIMFLFIITIYLRMRIAIFYIQMGELLRDFFSFKFTKAA